jgi:hypothetical protein
MIWLHKTFARGFGMIVPAGCVAGKLTQVAAKWKDRGILAPVRVTGIRAV